MVPAAGPKRVALRRAFPSLTRVSRPVTSLPVPRSHQTSVSVAPTTGAAALKRVHAASRHAATVSWYAVAALSPVSATLVAVLPTAARTSVPCTASVATISKWSVRSCGDGVQDTSRTLDEKVWRVPTAISLTRLTVTFSGLASASAATVTRPTVTNVPILRYRQFMSRTLSARGLHATDTSSPQALQPVGTGCGTRAGAR